MTATDIISAISLGVVSEKVIFSALTMPFASKFEGLIPGKYTAAFADVLCVGSDFTHFGIYSFLTVVVSSFVT